MISGALVLPPTSYSEFAVSTPEPHDDVLLALAQSAAAARPRLSRRALLLVIFPLILTAGMIVSAMLAGWVTAPIRD